MNDDTGEMTLAFSLAAIERLDDPNAVFRNAESWSQSIGIVDDDTERIERVVAEYGLRQDFDMQDRDKWFALDEIAETASTQRHVYVGASDEEMRESTMFSWEYVHVSEAAEKAGWNVSDPRSGQSTVTRLLKTVRGLLESR